MRGLGAVGELLSFLGKQGSRLLVLEFILYLGANFLKGRSRRGLDGKQVENHTSLSGRSNIRRCVLLRAEYRIHKLRRRSQARQHVMTSKEIRGDHRNV